MVALEEVQCAPKICEIGGGGVILPIFGDSEQRWPSIFRAILYFFGLLWTFLGISMVSDTFMDAIERITSKKNRCRQANGKQIAIKVWNDTVANLTLMALGSSAPEILLNVIELVSNDFYSGDLGPSVIVGSAAFNLLIISAVCVVCIPQGEIRLIKDVGVYMVTATFSIAAYFWMYLVVGVISPDVVDIAEGVITFALFPVLVSVAYAADRGIFSSMGLRANATHARVSFMEMSKDELAALEVRIRKENPHVSDVELAKIIERQFAAPKSRANYRVRGKRTASAKDKEGNHNLTAVVPIDTGVCCPTLEEDPKPVAIIEFASATYVVLECIGTVKVAVHRQGELSIPVTAAYKTRDGSASAGTDYEFAEGTVVFEPGEDHKTIPIRIIDDDSYEEDEDFFLDLLDASSQESSCQVQLGHTRTTTITIIDDDDPGSLAFEAECIFIEEGASKVVRHVQVKRKNGSSGVVSCKFQTRDETAVAGKDYEATEGIITFESGQVRADIPVTVLPVGHYDDLQEFQLVLTEVAGGARFDPFTEGGADSCICICVIKPNPETKDRVDRVFSVMMLDWGRAQVGNASWREQFVEAISVKGSADDEDDDGEPPTIPDYALHVIAVFWKVLFAFIPPSDYCGGWACFAISLVMIGCVTAVVGDLAALLGCVANIPDAITAITLVALGTSLPDTFASKTAAVQDPYADASVGNVTGSNSVNVFLGLGLPWFLGSVYWSVKGRDSEWEQKYRKHKHIVDPEGARFVVIGGDLSTSVIVFAVCAVLCLSILALRRKYLGGELGGPMPLRYATAIGLVAMWTAYIAISCITVLSTSSGC